MPRARTKTKAQQGKSVEALRHEEARRANLPSAEHQPLMADEARKPVPVTYQRNRDLDPQLMWRGKDTQDLSDLVVNAPPLYIQERVHPKALVADLVRHSQNGHKSDDDAADGHQIDMFADFNGLPEGADRTEFYQHDANWANRMILGDSLQVMSSLAEREGLRGKVQCIYIDPPYGIRFNSNFQWSTKDKDVRGNDTREHVTREPEQVKAFRDTWRDGVHSYLSYLRDRLMVARSLLAESGSIFVQIGDENIHLVRAVMDEVFGAENFISMITFKKTQYQESDNVSNIADYLLLYARNKVSNKHHKAYNASSLLAVDYSKYRKAFTSAGVRPIPQAWRDYPESFEQDWRPFRSDITLTQDGESSDGQIPWHVEGQEYVPGIGRHWRTHARGRDRLVKAGRVNPSRSRPFYIESYDDSPATNSSNIWTESLAGAQGKIFVVQTNERVVERCILMTTNPGDLVLDPTCGAGTTACSAEQWGRRWITIDTSRVALALTRARIMGARYPYYLLADSHEGQLKEAELSRRAPRETPTYGTIQQGFVYERVPHITLRSIANNAEIDVIYEDFQQKLEPLRQKLNASLNTTWEEWEIPDAAEESWPKQAHEFHNQCRGLRIARQKEIDASIAAKAENEYLYEKPYEDNSKVRVAGPFTVESISPHRTLEVARMATLSTAWPKPEGTTPRVTTSRRLCWRT